MSPPVRPVIESQVLPQRVDVVVIGGGIIGVSATWFLTKRGLKVALCEKGVIAGEQSSRNWGFCRQQGRDPSELPLIIEALRIWQGIDKEIEDKTGFVQAGLMYIAGTDEELEKYSAWTEHARQFQLDTRLLSGAEIKKMLPDLQADYLGALWTPSDGRAEPSEAAPAIASSSLRQGATVHTGCAVRGLETSGGHVSGVITEKGTIHCDAVLLAGGAWSSLFLQRHNIEFPQLKVRSSVLRTTPGPEISPSGIFCPDFGIRRRNDGKYTLSRGGPNTVQIVPNTIRWMGKFWNTFLSEHKNLKIKLDGTFVHELFQDTRWALDNESPFEKIRVLDPTPDLKVMRAAMEGLKTRFPILKELEIEECWAGMVDVTPDAVPCIAPMDSLPGLYLASGFSGHGFGIGPGAGKLAADLVTGAPPCVDPIPFRYSRFFDDSRLSPSGL